MMRSDAVNANVLVGMLKAVFVSLILIAVWVLYLFYRNVSLGAEYDFEHWDSGYWLYVSLTLCVGTLLLVISLYYTRKAFLIR